MPKKRFAIPFEWGTSKGKWGFVANEDAYKSIATILGVEEVSDADLKNVMMNIDADDIPVGRVVIHYEQGGKRKSAKVYYDPTKAASKVCADLIGENYKGGKIVAANLPRRRLYV